MARDGAARPRPAQLSRAMLVTLAATSLLSFVSGAAIWFLQTQTTSDTLMPQTVPRFWFILHGATAPLLSVLFGMLWATHMQAGWRMKINRRSGIALAVSFIILMITGVFLYYAGSENVRGTSVWLHRIFGILFFALIGFHGWNGRRAALRRM